MPTAEDRRQARMNHESPTIRPSLYTVGHSNHLLETFLDLLRSGGIRWLVDVRSNPYSRHAAHFNKENFERHLQHEGFSYTYLGHVLGGLPQDIQCYDAEGYVLYDRIASSTAFEREMTKLLQQASRVRTALLCGEEDPSECHRRIMLGRIAARRGYEVLHLRGDGRVQAEASMAEEERLRKTQGQLSLFDNEGDKPWRSAKPVARKRRPSPTSL